MYSEKKSVLQLVSLLVAHKIRRAIVCAGSRSSPLAQTLAACPNIETYPCVDERSGAFEAIGLMQATGEPVAICVTSGSALMDASPAVAEACYQELPLVVLSADRPAAWIDQRDGQTMRQAGALQNMVRCSVDLPGQDGPEEEWHRNRLINMALAAARGPVPGPVHINVPLTEPLFAFTARELPKERVLEVMRSSAFHLPEQQYREVAAEWQKAQRVLLICGQMRPHELDKDLLASFAGRVVPVFEHLANLDDAGRRMPCMDRADLFAGEGSENLHKYAPQLVITLGGHIISKRLKKYLRSLDTLSHWHVSADGAVADTFLHLTRVFATTASAFLRFLQGLDQGDGGDQPAQGEPGEADRGDQAGQAGQAQAGRRHQECQPGRTRREVDADFVRAWSQASQRLRATLARAEFSFTDPMLVREFFRHMPPYAGLHLANSSVVRHAQFWDLPEGTQVFCNRGINGIDGSLSAALGNAEALARTNTPLFCLIGDLSFFYDQNALWRTRLPENLRILLFNNREGNIFRTLGLSSPYLRSHIAGASELRAAGLCKASGIQYLCAETRDAFTRLLPDFIHAQGITLFEVVTEALPDAAASRKLNALLV